MDPNAGSGMPGFPNMSGMAGMDGNNSVPDNEPKIDEID